MGIKDLLRFMKPYVEPIHIKKYAGKRVGIDAYSWLHKGAYSCSMELCLNTEGDKKFQYLNYCMHRINLLRHHNINPVLVFDGCNIPSKALTEQDRHRKRKGNLDLAMEKLKEGSINAAAEIFQRAVSITPAIAHQLIQILKSENIEFIVAPYEADAQLAYLCSLDAEKGGIAAVISEDSDLLAYGCSSVVFKMDRYGNGEEIVIDKVFNSVGRVPSFRHFDKELFTGMCVLSGCDFLPSVPGIGIGKAHALVSKYRNLERVLSILKYEKGNQMPENYFKSFKEAFAVFLHARIYDADSKRLKHLTPLPETLVDYSNEDLDFLGPEICSSLAIGIAEGQLDPLTMKAFNEFSSCNIQLKPTNIIQSSTRLTKEETIAPKSCFTIVSSQKTRTKRITVMEQELVCDTTKPKADLEDLSRLKSDTSKLENLIPPLTNDILSKHNTFPAKSSTVPNNNPFKKQKLATGVTKLEDLETSVVTEVEDLEVLTTPHSQKSVESKPLKKTGEKKKVKSVKKVENIQENKKNTILNFFSRV